MRLQEALLSKTLRVTFDPCPRPSRCLRIRQRRFSGSRSGAGTGGSRLLFTTETWAGHSFYNGNTYLDTLSREATEHFIHITPSVAIEAIYLLGDFGVALDVRGPRLAAMPHAGTRSVLCISCRGTNLTSVPRASAAPASHSAKRTSSTRAAFCNHPYCGGDAGRQAPRGDVVAGLFEGGPGS